MTHWSLAEARRVTYVQSLQLGFEFPLGSAGRSGLGRQVLQLLVGFGQFGLGLAASAVGLFQKCSRFFQFSLSSQIVECIAMNN